MATPAQYAAALIVARKMAEADIAELSFFVQNGAREFVDAHLERYVRAAVDAALSHS